MRTAIATSLTLITAVVTNYATQLGPAWTRNPMVVWPLVSALAALTVGATVLARADTPKKRERLTKIRTHSLRPPAPDAPCRGREHLLDELKGLLKDAHGQFAVLCGPGGVGKTTIAAQLATRAAGKVWWVRFTDKKTFKKHMFHMARELGVLDEPFSLTDSLWKALAKRSGWLLVLDNIDEPQLICPKGEQLAQYRGWVRGGGGGLLLVTSRLTGNETWGSKANLLHVEPLPNDDAARVLLDAAPESGNRREAEALAERLGGFPLALRVAGRTLGQPTARHRTFTAYRVALDNELGDILAAPYDGHLNEIQRRALLRYTWEVSLDQLAGEGFPLARPLLRMLSLTADDAFPRDLISPALLKQVIAGRVTTSAVDGGLDGLYRHGLIGIRRGLIPCVTLHPLIREINALQLTEEGVSGEWMRLFDQFMVEEAKRVGSHCLLDRAELLVPHLALVAERSSNKFSPKSDVQRALRKLEKLLEGSHHSGAARRLGQALSKTTRTVHPPRRPGQLPESE